MLINLICTLEPALPPRKKQIMYFNILVDGLIGLVPILGDLADGIYKCNTRNVSILEAELEKRGRARIAEQQAAVGQATIAESREMRTNSGPSPARTLTEKPKMPEAAYASQQSGGGRSWFGGRKERDIESGNDLTMSQP
jgi:Domain of unknown function (DUF4112)